MLYAHLTSPGVVRMVDNNGKEVHQWKMPARPGRHARILPNGNLAYNGVHPDGPKLFPLWQKYRGGLMLQVDHSGKEVMRWEDPLAHHDQNHLDDGTLLCTTLQPLNPTQAASVPGGIPGSEAPDGNIYSDCIEHVDPRTGETLWHWSLIDNINPAGFPLQPHYTRDHYPLINSVSFLRDGDVLASLRSVSAVIIISKATGEVLWHLDSTVIAQQHHATELDDGSILIFDNGVYRHHESMPYSRVIQVDRATKKIVWQYKDPHPTTFFTPFMGAAQRLSNGNTLITEAGFGRIFEVTKEGEMCWEYVVPEFATYEGLGAPELEGIFDYPSNAVFRAYKYTPEEVPWLVEKLRLGDVDQERKDSPVMA